MGRKRSAGIDLLLFVVTLGVYWFVWMYKAFNEVAVDRQQTARLKPGLWIGLLVPLWVIGVGLGAVSSIMEATAEPTTPGTPPSIADIFVPSYDPAAIAGYAVLFAFYLLQGLYLMNATRMTGEGLRAVGDANVPSPALALTFCLLNAVAGPIPFVGLLFSLAAFVVSIVYVVLVQGALNRYWDRRASPAPFPPPPPTYAPQAAPAYGAAYGTPPRRP